MRLVEQRQHQHPRDRRRRVALELVARGRQRRLVGHAELDALLAATECTAGPRLVALSLHRAVERLLVHRGAARGGRVLDEVVGDTERVVQLEGRVAAEHLRGVERLRDLRLKAWQAVLQHRVEAVLFGGDGLGDRLLVGAQVGIGVAHLAHEHRNHLVQERLGEPEVLPVAHCAPHDLAQHIAAPLVRRDDTVADEERHRPRVVGDDAHRDVGLFVLAVGLAGQLADPREQRHEQVGVVVRLLALQYRGDALEPHARIDGGGGQRRQRAVGAALELHEHVVPDFNFRVGAGAAADEVDLRAAAARTGVAHLPEVVVGAELHDAVGRHELPPDVVGFVVARDAVLALEHRDHQLLGRHAPDVRQHLPGELDRVGLEVVAEREVAEHLEEGVVAVRRPDVVEVVVLAADAHHLLRGRRPRELALFAPEEHVLELVHPGVGEEQRRVVPRDERRTGDDAVTVLLEVLEERAPDFVGSHGRYL